MIEKLFKFKKGIHEIHFSSTLISPRSEHTR